MFTFTVHFTAMQIREIKKSDNPEIAKVIRDVFIELDAPKVGTAYADPILDTLFEVYQNSKFKIEIFCSRKKRSRSWRRWNRTS